MNKQTIEKEIEVISGRKEIVCDGMTPLSSKVQRIIDIFIAFFCICFFSPIMFVCWVLVKNEDGGNAIFMQERIGKKGKPFHLYKFRSMKLNAESRGPQLSRHNKALDDPRLTQVGKCLRSHHLDELPQLWNVLRGDMSFVGPRPERKFYIDKIMALDSRYECLYQIRPGVTSYATLYNGYTDTMEKMLKRLYYDLYYLEHRSLKTNMAILWNTFVSIMSWKKF